MKPYESYKKTNIPWLDEVPSHWDFLRNKNVMTEKKDVVGSESSKYTLLSLTLNGVIKRDMENAKGKFPKEFDTYKIVSAGEMIFCLFDIDETPRTVGLSSFNGMITGAYDVFSISNINSKYLYYYYLSVDTAKAMKPLYTGLRKVIGVPKFLGTKLPSPPLTEQDQIVRYLDWQISKINKLVQTKKRQIELLKEQKQAVINKAVTKGLDDSVPMKDSDVEWLGNVPEHWEVLQLKKVSDNVKTGGTPTGVNEEHFEEDGFPWFTPGDFTENIYISNSQRRLSELGKNSVVAFPKGVILMIGIGGTMGKVCISDTDCSCNQQINAISTNININNIYLVYYLRAIKEHIFNCAQYTTLPILNQEATKRILSTVPPLQEQQAIVDYITDITGKIDTVIKETEQEIELLSEYKTSLISSVVTGKVDVRDVVVPEFETVEDVEEDAEEEMEEM